MHSTRLLINAAASHSLNVPKRILQIFRDGILGESYLNEPLADGEQGNWQTLAAMAEIVNEDRSKPDLRNFVLRDVIGRVPGHDMLGEIEAIYRFCRDRITYRRDPFDIERVADIWSTMYGLAPEQGEPEGDCGIKSTFFCSAAAILGYRPAFVIAKQFEDMAAYNHIYAAVMTDDGWRYYDPTPEDAESGWHLEAFDSRIYDIFGDE